MFRCARATLRGWTVASFLLVPLGCDQDIYYRSDEGRYRFATPGRPPPTADDELGARPTFLAGRRVEVRLWSYCPWGWAGECVSFARLGECVDVEIPPELLPDGEADDHGPPEVVVPEGISTIPVRAKEGCEHDGPPLYDDRVTLRGVDPGDVSATFLPIGSSYWRSIVDGTDDPRDVWSEAVALSAVPPPSDPDTPVPVAPGTLDLAILLRDGSGVPVATTEGTAAFEVLAGAPDVTPSLGDEPVSWTAAGAELAAGDRVAVHLWGAGEPLGAYGIETVAVDAVARLDLAVAYLDEVFDEDAGPDGTVVAVAAAYDGAGRLLRGGDVSFVVEGAGFDPDRDRNVGPGVAVPVAPLDGGTDVRCATVHATLGPQRASTQVCWGPEAGGGGCTCRADGERPPRSSGCCSRRSSPPAPAGAGDGSPAGELRRRAAPRPAARRAGPANVAGCRGGPIPRTRACSRRSGCRCCGPRWRISRGCSAGATRRAPPESWWGIATTCGAARERPWRGAPPRTRRWPGATPVACGARSADASFGSTASTS